MSVDSKAEVVTEKQKPNTVNTRAAKSSMSVDSKAEVVTEKQKPNTVNTRNSEKGEISESKINNENISEKPVSDYCKGWKEGYIKAFSKATGEKISSTDVPNCVAQGDCEGYKCGYAAGVRNAERRIK